MDQFTINQVHQLKQQGVSYRKIAEELDISKAMVEKAVSMTPTLDGQSDSLTDAPKPSSNPVSNDVMPKPRGKTADELELGKLDMTLSHQRSMKQLQIKEDELALERQRINLEAAKVENDKRMLSLREQQHASAKQEEVGKQQQQQALLVTKFNRLLKELLKNCEDATWSEEDVDEFIQKTKDLLAKVGRICEAKALDEDTLVIYQSAKKLIKLVEETKENESHLLGSDVDFDFDKQQIEQIKSWEVSHFTDSVDDEEDSEEDEDGEDSERTTELLDSFNELVDELLDDSDNTEWTSEEYLDYEKRITDLQAELSEYLDDLEDIEADQQAIIVNLEKLWDFIDDHEAVIEEDDEKETLTLNTTPKQKQKLQELKLDDFWQEA